MENNKEVYFKERLEDGLAGFGEGSQEGVKAMVRECQDIFGCVSQGHQKQIAQKFKLDPKLVKTILKFMPSIKESRVQYELICCSGARCAKNGSLDLIKTLKEGLGLDIGEVSEDGRIRLTMQNCFKKCNMGPNLMVNGRLYNHMDREKAESLLKEIGQKPS